MISITVVGMVDDWGILFVGFATVGIAVCEIIGAVGSQLLN